MDKKLKDLIEQADRELHADKAERDAKARRDAEARAEEDAAMFRRQVEGAFGKEVLEALGPVTFHKSFLSQSMTFTQDGRPFRLQQVTDGLVQVENAEDKGKMLGHQFNLRNQTAKRDFLHILGAALGS